MAFPQCLRVHCYWLSLRHHALRYGPVASSRATIAPRSVASMEYLGALRHLPSSARVQRLLRLQRPTANRILLCGLRLRSTGDPDRHRDVAGSGEPVSSLCQTFWWTTVSTFSSLSDDAWFLRLYRCACNFDRDDRLRAQYESHRDGYRRPSQSVGNDPGLRRHRRCHAYMDRSALCLLVLAAGSAACSEVRHLPSVVDDAEPAHSESALYGER